MNTKNKAASFGGGSEKPSRLSTPKETTEEPKNAVEAVPSIIAGVRLTTKSGSLIEAESTMGTGGRSNQNPHANILKFVDFPAKPGRDASVTSYALTAHMVRGHETNPNTSGGTLKCSIQILADKRETASQDGPLQEFTIFNNLPPEIRIKIWKAKMDQPRIIEFEKTSKSERQVIYEVSRRSRRPPDLVCVNKEAREEALKHYELLRFPAWNEIGILQHKLRRSAIYFNPESDIVYFGEGTGVMALAAFSRQLRSRGITVPNVAMGVTGRTGDFGPRYTSSSEWKVGALHALHGINPENETGWILQNSTMHRIFPGFPGLKKIYFLVESKFREMGVGEIDTSDSFRPAGCSGLDRQSIHQKFDLEHAIRDVGVGGGIKGVGKNNWGGGEMPTFEFVSWSLRRPVAETQEFMKITPKEAEQLNEVDEHGRTLVAELERGSGCSIQISKLGGNEYQEVGIFGTESAQVARLWLAVYDKLNPRTRASGDGVPGVENSVPGGEENVRGKVVVPEIRNDRAEQARLCIRNIMDYRGPVSLHTQARSGHQESEAGNELR